MPSAPVPLNLTGAQPARTTSLAVPTIATSRLVEEAWGGQSVEAPRDGEAVPRYGETEAVSGEWGPASCSTTLVLHFSNAYSLMREKVVAYEILIYRTTSSRTRSQRAGAGPSAEAGEAESESDSLVVNGQLVLQGVRTTSFSEAKQLAVRSALAGATLMNTEDVELLPATDEGSGNIRVRFQITARSGEQQQEVKASLTKADFNVQFAKLLKARAMQAAAAAAAKRQEQAAAQQEGKQQLQ